MIVSGLQWAQDKLQFVGGWVKLLVMIPCYILLAIVVAATLLPIIMVWYFLM